MPQYIIPPTSRDAVWRSENGPTGRAMQLAQTLRQRSVAAQDRVLGSEAELAREHGVGRGTVRTALRELERQGIVAISRGRGGGSRVTGVPAAGVGQALSDFLTVVDAPLHEVAGMAMWTYVLGARWAATRAGSEQDCHIERACALTADRASRGASLNDWYAMRRAVVAASGNRTLSFLNDAFQAAYRDVLAAEFQLEELEPARSLEQWQQEERVVTAVLARDPDLAEIEAQTSVAIEAASLALSLAEGKLTRTLCPKTLFHSVGPNGKLAHQTLRALHAVIRNSALSAGDRIGTVASLAQQFGLGLDVMREALLLGQKQGLVVLQRGRYGGVFVGQPEPGCVIRAAAQHLRKTIPESDIFEIWQSLARNGPQSQFRELVVEIVTLALAKHTARAA